MLSPRTVRMIAALMLMTVLAACGSTVQLGPNGAVPGQQPVAGDGLGLATPGASEAAVAGNELTTTTGGATTGGQAAGAAPAGGATSAGSPGSTGATSTTGGGSGSSGGGGAVAPGLTKDTAYVGFAVVEGSGAANAAIGAAGITQGEPREYIRVVVKDLNRRGGILGRKVEPVIFTYDAQSTQTDDEHAEKACQYWTEDNEVFAAAATASFRDSLRECMAKKGVPLIGVGLGMQDAQAMARYPLYAEVTMNLTRIASNLVSGLSRHNYFKAASAAQPTKVGILSIDYPTFDRAVSGTLIPSLRAAGVKEPPVPFKVRRQTNSNDLGPVAQDVNSAILRFRQENVTHVVILETQALLAFMFMRSAESQGYRPRYGLHTQNGGQIIAGQVPHEQLRNAVGIGWAPAIDVRDQDAPRLPGRIRCLKIMQDEGHKFPDANAKGVALNYCEGAFAVKAAADAGGSPTSSGFMAGLERLGGSYDSPHTFTTQFSNRRHDGVSSYRLVRWTPSCSCFKYTSRNIEAR